ncbi:Phosphoserine aminotransferase [Caldithrix abyssi DSM 13497]|uniref:Phosphoserine aminotransferase n=2 Tax=Caldithrix abyssi DSM 13497 TaxID=880073 RepID=H1XR02_CALAY|nr:Phosphoserine aminotransferase [Caldithrix abyssi DSM 13497]
MFYQVERGITMKEGRIYNFNPGPAALPLPVLEEVQKDLLNYKGEGISILEMSHRSKTFDGIIKDAERLLKEIMDIPQNYKVLFMQGGATLQFAAVPLNLIGEGQFAEYVNTGSWSKKAIQEAQKLGKKVNVVASSEDESFSYIPGDIKVSPNAAYLHITSNNTIFGTQFQQFPETGDVALIADMSSDIACRKIDVSKFALIYAGAQKNMGPSGVTVVIIREDLLEKSPDNIPTMTSYKIIGGKDSLYNTPPTFAVYIVKLVLEWMKAQGGLEKIEQINRQKAGLIYDALDQSSFYRGTARPDSRSLMNVTFRLPSEELEKKFVAEALENGMLGLKGHRSVGGIRASIYNAVPMEAVEKLVDFMKKFEKANS